MGFWTWILSEEEEPAAAAAEAKQRSETRPQPWEKGTLPVGIPPSKRCQLEEEKPLRRSPGLARGRKEECGESFEDKKMAPGMADDRTAADFSMPVERDSSAFFSRRSEQGCRTHRNCFRGGIFGEMSFCPHPLRIEFGPVYILKFTS